MVSCHTPKVLIKGLIGKQKTDRYFRPVRFCSAMKIYSEDGNNPNVLALAAA
jgi:hypothetical protein